MDKQKDQNAQSNNTTLHNSIMVEFNIEKSTRPSGLYDPANQILLDQKSKESIEKSMKTIIEMANQTYSRIQNLQCKPKQIQIEFGVKFDNDLGALIANSYNESSINVKLMWDG